jgi:hypothetical protein
VISIKIPQNHNMFPLVRQKLQSGVSNMRLSRKSARNSIQTVSSLSNGPVPMTQQSNSLMFGRDQQGLINISELRQDVGDGALVLHTMREDGVMSSETLSRLPKWVALEYQAALLKPFGREDTGKVDIVLNRAARPFQLYRSDELSEPFLPAILERDQSTITTVVGRGTYSLEDGMFHHNMNRKRIGWDEQEYRKRQRRGRSTLRAIGSK